MEWFEIVGVASVVTGLTFIRLKYGRNSRHYRYLREEYMSEKWSRERKAHRD
ncbi:hypothetical protein [Alkalihalobacillus sp. CinArs1]|uniref:hypothetical protein n=1 Tax=Alkalihalobacillus sp. CinArs1 TaxID=2995314 RepID=UPI0022DD82A6|nr:hypothetical protein [Alkalihalobacillus sp. CinArs1]